jgi:hypothetical protein
MKTRRQLHSLPVHFAILRAASFLVPGQERAEWLAEWRGELWHVARDIGHAHGDKEITAFCLGAFHDASWLRCNHQRSILRRFFLSGSASRCGLFLATWAIVSMLICLTLPAARRALLLPSPYPNASDLVVISGDGYSGIQFPTVRLDDYRSWTVTGRRLFTGMAFYQPVIRRIHVAPHHTAELSIARASGNLFDLLNLTPFRGKPFESGRPNMARLILSQQIWRNMFHADAHAVGHVIEVAGKPVLIAGVISGSSWQLPGQMDAWLLEDQSGLDALPSGSTGFVIARVRENEFPGRPGSPRHIVVSRNGEGTYKFDCISVAQQSRLPVSIFLLALILACLALPATTPLLLGDYPVHRGRLSWKPRLRRWVFFFVKLALIVPVVYFTAVDLACCGSSLDAPTALYIQFTASFSGFLFTLRWALQDQRRRCPVCLRLLSNPARVGQASHNFLAWNGTELICASGHGLLHIPEIPTSWFRVQRWLYLDSSWGSLFTEPYVPSPEPI